MIEALIAGERDPRRLAELARAMKAKRSELITALTSASTPSRRASPDAANPDRRA